MFHFEYIPFVSSSLDKSKIKIKTLHLESLKSFTIFVFYSLEFKKQET